MKQIETVSQALTDYLIYQKQPLFLFDQLAKGHSFLSQLLAEVYKHIATDSSATPVATQLIEIGQFKELENLLSSSFEQEKPYIMNIFLKRFKGYLQYYSNALQQCVTQQSNSRTDNLLSQSVNFIKKTI